MASTNTFYVSIATNSTKTRSHFTSHYHEGRAPRTHALMKALFVTVLKQTAITFWFRPLATRNTDFMVVLSYLTQ